MRYSLLMFKKNKMEERKVKKSILLLALVVALVSGFASVALADASHPATFVSNGQNVYLQLDANGKAVPIHSGYTVNTDACASCHSVHNAKDQDRMLLQWTSPSEACMACHDGTVTAAYDVEHGKIADTNGLTNGGLFATMAATAGSASQHDVESSVTLSANSVPGGKTGAAGADGWGSWDGSEFECTSCHEPHGNGGNSRLLNPNPNGVMQKISKAKLPGTAGVYKFSNVTIATSPDTLVTMSTDPTTNTAAAVTPAFLTGKKLPMMTPKFFDAAGTDISTKVTVLPTNDGLGNANSKDAIVTWADASAAPAAIFTDYTPVMQVEMTFLTAKYSTTETIKYGIGMQEFCAACHTDYYGARGNSRAYATTNQHHNGGISRAGQGYPELGNSVAGSTGSCLTCHYAHGVDQSRWDATKNNAGTNLWVSKTETAGSSALKRLPNMGTCEVCHAWEPKAYNATNNMVLKATPDKTRPRWFTK